MTSDSLPLSTRMEVFRALVEAEDQGLAPVQAREEVAGQFHITPEQVKTISDEGVDKNWPPLEPCEDDEPVYDEDESDE
jgi:hypothetical protein